MEAQQAEYHDRRKRLIASEKALRFDYAARNAATEVELNASKVIAGIKHAETNSLWRETDLTYPGMQFLYTPNLLRRSKLFEIINKMPKGALLHSHFDAMVPPTMLLQWAIEEPMMHIGSTIALINDEAYAKTQFFFLAMPEKQYTSKDDPTSADYIAESLYPLSKLRSQLKDKTDLLDSNIIRCFSMSATDSYIEYTTSDLIWAKFLRCFRSVAGIVHHEPIYRKHIHTMLEILQADGVYYVETRMNMIHPNITTTRIVNGKVEVLDHEGMVAIFEEEVKKFAEESKAKGKQFWGARIIYVTVRVIEKEEMWTAMTDCMDLKRKFPDTIVGFDIVGHEDPGKTLLFYIEEFLRFRNQCEQDKLDIPFFFHAGETLGDGDKVDDNLFDALLLGTKRIGHGVSLHKHPVLMKECKNNGILIEVCPISNELLRLTSTVLTHPLPSLLANGLPVALCSDDPCIFGNSGLSHDFFQVLVGYENVDLISLGELARLSIVHSAMPDTQKKRCLELYRQDWLSFCKSIQS